MRKVIFCMAIILTLAITTCSVAAKGNTVEDDWLIENPGAWEVVGEGEDIAINCLEDYADRILFDRQLDTSRGFYIQWDIGWPLPYEAAEDPQYYIQTSAWSMAVVGSEKECRLMSRIQSLNGTFIMEISYHDGFKSQWVPIPISVINSENANTGWKETDFSVRMILWCAAGSETVHFEARNTQNEPVFVGEIDSSYMSTDDFYTKPLQFWVGSDGSNGFNIANLVVLEEYDGKAAVPQKEMALAYTTIPRVEVTVPTLTDTVAKKDEKGVGTVEIIAICAGVALVAAALVVLFAIARKQPTSPKK